MTSSADDRQKIVEYLERQLVGPVDGPDEVLHEAPDRRYLTGLLYPRTEVTSYQVAEQSDEILDEVPGQVGNQTDEADEDPLTLAGQNKPSSVGLSFVTSECSPIIVEIEAARYVPAGRGRDDRQEWRRTPIRLVGDDAVRIEPPGDASQARLTGSKPILDGRASIEVVWRRQGHAGAIVTVSMVNQVRAETHAEMTAGCLLQVTMQAKPAAGTIERYPSTPHLYGDEETEELELLYRTVPTYAIGHGAAAAWTGNGRETPEWVHTAFLPRQVVPGISFEVAGHEKILDLARLTEFDTEAWPELVRGLNGFVDSYEAWADSLRTRVDSDVPPALRAAAARVISDVDAARTRMRAGVRLLEADPTVRRAFALANRAMHRQMVHSGPSLAGRPHDPADARAVNPDYPADTHCWRPFQLGFLLLTLEGAATEDSEDRDLVDLIWFPTGGGKTEAYLGLTAFVILLRRLRGGDSAAGTTVITRYTLRLLTAQQFQRAATLICSCELLRRDNEAELGSEPISIGLWVGGGNSPNTYVEARKLLQRLRESEPTTESFQIETCPWCGTRITPGERSENPLWAVRATNNSFEVYCPNHHCPFHERLPLSSVDEDLYERPPTFLVGTVDKFARTVWDPRSGVFFGSGSHPGPSLIIQDEFHLISGPLGTIVGIYEAAFDVLLKHNKARPKFVASTATIRRAEEQTRGVFGREVALFPPAGLEADDSYFVRTDHSAPGRLYTGVMPQGHTPLTALVHLAAALLQAPVDLDLTPSGQDAYQTLVAYHNSLRELGKTITLAHDDIPARVKVIAKDAENPRKLTDDDVVELTSNVASHEIPRVLERLGRAHDQERSVSLAASTNMLSVGVDVPRLALMVVVGQPKTTAEYIQASSRVGRSRERPGLVVTLYSPSKPRDRSHYEGFTSDHAKLYRSVEPTSVTPFSLPARNRALHADLVILARHARGWSGEKDAAQFDQDDPMMTTLLDMFLARASDAEYSGAKDSEAKQTEAAEIEQDLWQLAAEWREKALRVDGDEFGLTYRAVKHQPGLLRRYDEAGDGWPTLDSMRNVDVTVVIKIRGADK
ncbi:helicase-related protein [Pseudofrankia sp. BMG5.36]|uniref:helicase-related protein n=1 Tax=Pseudofrankia sp. BMG5.36 TaxID=1834512 RepID=UPI0008D90AD0|nr:helicase-related protein [Pseudofrankia sp. BMG5.36]OHV66831.1 helicase [Pseudofrankia sp. BMG5.36]